MSTRNSTMSIAPGTGAFLLPLLFPALLLLSGCALAADRDTPADSRTAERKQAMTREEQAVALPGGAMAIPAGRDNSGCRMYALRAGPGQAALAALFYLDHDGRPVLDRKLADCDRALRQSSLAPASPLP